MAEFTDLSTIATTPLKANDKQLKKRGVMSGRLRLLPIGDSPASSYDVPASNNNNNGGSSSTTVGNNATALTASHKLKKITRKRELVEAVRKANSPIVFPGRDSGMTSSLRSLHDNPLSVSVPETGTGQKDVEFLEDGVNLNVRKFNEHKMLVERRQKELNVLLLETQELSRIQNQETPISKTNHRIKHEIAECTASMEEQMHLRRQLEHMVRRLQTTQLRVNAHVQAMSKAVDESSREGDEVKLLCRQLEAGKARAVQFLQEVQLQLQVERKARARELCDHEVRARNSQKMEAWRIQRVQERAEIAAELRGDLSAEEEARLLRSIESRERANEALHLANLTKSEKVADYEAVLDQLKLAAGANSLEGVVEKLFAQGATTVSLEKEKAQAEARLIAARHEKEQALQALNELKASGIGGIELNREVYNTLENEIQQAKATLKVNKSAFERLDGVITGIQQGSYGLAQRLRAFDDVLELSSGDSAISLLGGAVGSSSSGTGAGTRSENMDSLAVAELKLTRILELIGQQNSSVNSFGGFGGATADESEDGFEDGSSRADLDDRNALWSPTANSDPVLHRNNIRVRPGPPSAIRARGVARLGAVRHLDAVGREQRPRRRAGAVPRHSQDEQLASLLRGHAEERVGGEAEGGGRERSLGRRDAVKTAKAQPVGGGHPAFDVADAAADAGAWEPERQGQQVLRLRHAAQFQGPLMPFVAKRTVESPLESVHYFASISGGRAPMEPERVVSDLDVAAQYAELELRSVVEQFAGARVTPVAAAAASASTAAEASDDDTGDEGEDAVGTTNTVASSLSSSSTSSDEDDDDDEDDDEESRAALREEIEAALEKEESRVAAGPLKTANEVAAVPVREPSVELTPDCPIARCGTVLSASVPGLMLTIKSDANAKPLDEESVLCLEDRTVIGCVDEVFGPVMMPMYLVRFENADKMPARVAVGTIVYYATEHTTYIVPADIQDKGTDASNIFDEETDETLYSDDEAESAAKRQNRKRTRGGSAAEAIQSRAPSASSSHVPTAGASSSSRSGSSSSHSEYRQPSSSSGNAYSVRGGGRDGGGGSAGSSSSSGRGGVASSERPNYVQSGPALVQFQTQSHGGQTNYTSQPGFIVSNLHGGGYARPSPMGYAPPPPMGYAQPPLMPYGQVPIHQPPHPFAPQFHPQQQQHPHLAAYPPAMPGQPFYQPAPPQPYLGAPQYAPQSTVYYQQQPPQQPQQPRQQAPPPPLPPGSYEQRR
ncbi:hypothetical protein PybrP1_000484 [[Pythium] brassicae (nom. inval.)]|nr:hypothetical protein PybrP1_000484 [[Pythium] brassicae (nom. inval.)]